MADLTERECAMAAQVCDLREQLAAETARADERSMWEETALQAQKQRDDNAHEIAEWQEQCKAFETQRDEEVQLKRKYDEIVARLEAESRALREQIDMSGRIDA